MSSIDRSRVFLIPILLVAFTITYFSMTSSFSTSTLYNSVSKSSQIRPASTEAEFIAATLVEEPFDPHSIRLVCAEKKWTPGLVFLCNNPVGGLGNLRVSILTCVRFAIEAGASLVMPHIIVRNPDDIYEIRTGKRKPLSHMFDEATFVDNLREACPQLTLYETLDDFPNSHNAYPMIPLLPEDLPTPADLVPKTGLEHPEYWRGHFEVWLSKFANHTVEKPAVVDLQRSYLQFPVYYDGADFVNNFGRLLQFRRDAREIAGSVLYAMNQTYKLNITDPSQGIYRNSFFGVHLRTEIDSQKAWPGWGFGTLDAQAGVYLNHGQKHNLTLIYVASGDSAEISKFSGLALDMINATTTTKFKLLRAMSNSKPQSPVDSKEVPLDEEPTPLQALEAMTWDQQAEVDFLVMLKASQFVGVGHSSFTWNVALRRRKFSKIERGWLDGPYILSDDLSQVMGKPREWPEYASCMWP